MLGELLQHQHFDSESFNSCFVCKDLQTTSYPLTAVSSWSCISNLLTRMPCARVSNSLTQTKMHVMLIHLKSLLPSHRRKIDWSNITCSSPIHRLTCCLRGTCKQPGGPTEKAEPGEIKFDYKKHKSLCGQATSRLKMALWKTVVSNVYMNHILSTGRPGIKRLQELVE